MQGLDFVPLDNTARAALDKLQAQHGGVFVPLAGGGMPTGEYVLQLFGAQWYVWERDPRGGWRPLDDPFAEATAAAQFALTRYAARITRGYPTQGAKR